MMKVSWQPNISLEKSGLKIVRFLHKAGFQAYFVGGFVRNILLKRPSDNIDIATDALPQDVENVLDAAGIKHKAVGKIYGTILVINRDGPIEITTFRSEGKYTDRRHPDEIRFSKNLTEDASRRDFTINALYLDPKTGEISDPVNGLRDLKHRVIKFVGDPKERVTEDALRLIRAVRLAAQLKFTLDKDALKALNHYSRLIGSVSGERIKQELDKIMLSNDPAEGLRVLDKAGVLTRLIPEMEPMKMFYHHSKLYHLEGSMFEHSLLAVACARRNELDLLYSLLFHDIGKPATGKKTRKPEGWVISSKGHADVSADIFRKFADKLKFTRSSSSTIDWLIRNHMHFQDFYQMRLNKQMKLASHPAFELLLEHWRCDEQANKRVSYLDDYHKKFLKSYSAGKKLLVTLKKSAPLFQTLARGDLIMKYGNLKPGPHLGKKIEAVRTKIVEGEIKNRKDLEKYLTT